MRPAVIVAVLCALAAPAGGADVSESIALAIRLRVDPSLASRRVGSDLMAEAAALWQPYGVRLVWVDPDRFDSPGDGASLDASVERDPELPDQIGGPFVLGHTLVGRDAPLWPPIRLSFDATARALAHRGNSLGTRSGLVLDRETGIALGRVLAHEIGHVLLSAPFHDRAGLMRAVLLPSELADPDRVPFRLTCGGVVRLRNRLRALTGDERADPVGAPCIRVKAPR